MSFLKIVSKSFVVFLPDVVLLRHISRKGVNSMNYEPLSANFEDTELEIISECGERFITVRDLAAGLGAKKRSILKLIGDLAGNNELKEGVHFLCIPLSSRGGTQNTMIVSYRGVLRIVMRMNSPRAARFRDWCETVLYGIMIGSVNTAMPVQSGGGSKRS